VKVTVVYALPRKAQLASIDLPEGATAGDAMRAFLDHAGMQGETGLSVGIQGRCVDLDEVLQPDDRVEIYRGLMSNPKEIRRNRIRREFKRS